MCINIMVYLNKIHDAYLVGKIYTLQDLSAVVPNLF